MTHTTIKIFELFVILAFIPTQAKTLSIYHNFCKSDHDCTDTNTYCYESGKCVECTICSVYNRHPSTNTPCAKNKNQCGQCFSGMEAEINFDGTLSICQPILASITTIRSTTDQDTIIENNYSIALIVIACLFIFILLCVTLVMKFKACQIFGTRFRELYQNCPVNNNNNCPTVPPPPYTEKNPSAPPEEGPLIRKREVQDDTSQRANAFACPHYVTGGNLSQTNENNLTLLNPPENDSQPNSNDDSAISQPDDEATQPSHWSPTSETPNSAPTSFADVLRLNQLSISQPDNLQNSQLDNLRNSQHSSNSSENNNSFNTEPSGPGQSWNVSINIINNQVNKS